MEHLSAVLFSAGGLWAIFCLTMSLRKATYETTRPWSGLRQRARKRKDGTDYVQSYWSKGPGATKATLDRRWSRLSLIGTAAVLISLFIR